MRALTGLGGFDWFLITLYALALVLVWRSRKGSAGGSRILGVLVVPLASGLVAIGVLATVYPSETRNALARISDHRWGLAFAAGTLLVAFALVDFLLENTVARPSRLLARGAHPRSWFHDAFLAFNVLVAAAVAVIGLSKLAEQRPNLAASPSAYVGVQSEYAAGKITDIVFGSHGQGYVALDEGEIARFDLPAESDGRLDLETVARVEHPRGLAILGRTLFVSELGQLPCDPKPCEGYDFPGLATEAGDRRYLKRTRGRVLAFDLTPEGQLTNRRVVVSNLPVANTLHGVNGIAAGPDGLLYLAIGNLDALYRRPGIAKRLGVPRPDLLGTIVRFAPDGTRFEVFANGLRNVYDLTFDRRGNAYAVDNNGPTLHGWRQEELLQIRKGSNYGYPYNGTFGPYTVRTEPPLFVLAAAGSAGIEWASNLGLEPGVLVGGCGDVTYIRVRGEGRSAVVEEPSDATVWLQVPGCVSTIEPGPNDTIVLGLYPYAGDDGPSLFVLTVAD